eukprot:2531620-Rhodomonas_salina.2
MTSWARAKQVHPGFKVSLPHRAMDRVRENTAVAFTVGGTGLAGVLVRVHHVLASRTAFARP